MSSATVRKWSPPRIESTSRPPSPGTAKIFSMTSEPPMMPVISGMMVLAMGTSELRNAWRQVASFCVRPLVRASSMYSEESVSMSSPRR